MNVAVTRYLFFMAVLLITALLLASAMENMEIRRFPDISAVVLLGILTGATLRYVIKNEDLTQSAIFDEEIFNLVLLPVIMYVSPLLPCFYVE